MLKRFSVLSVLLVSTLMAPVKSQTEPNRVSWVVEAVRHAAPAVVNISTEKIVSVREFNPFGNEWIFDYFAPYTRRNVTHQSLGSGVVIRPDGTILTNEHIILPASKITITMSNGDEYQAELLGASRRFDLAVLKITSPDPLPFISPTDSSDLMIGETVIAIGNPFGLSSSVTTGVISAIKRTLTFEDPNSRNTHTYHDFIQTDASINPGNSGGPLLNIKGDLIGINTAIYANAEGIGFAIPIDKANRVIDDLINTGSVPRIWLGLRVQQLTQLLAKSLNIPEKSGVLIADVQKNSPGSIAGINAGDVILTIDAAAVSSLSQYKKRLRDYTPGDEISFEIIRRKNRIKCTVTAVAFPEDQSEELASNILGIYVKNLDRRLNYQYKLHVKKGVFVESVRSGSPADRVGIRKGDAIIQVDQNKIENTDQFYEAVKSAAHRDSISLVVVRNKTAYRVTLEIE